MTEHQAHRKAEIVVKFAIEPETTRQCPVCGNRFYMEGKTWAYLENTTTPVCLNCAGPELAALLETKRRQDTQIAEAMELIKDDKLKHYQIRGPMLFAQVDGFLDDPDDPDDLGVSIYSRNTWELMTGAPAARLLLRADLTEDEAKRAVAVIHSAVVGGSTNKYLKQNNMEAAALQEAEFIRGKNDYELHLQCEAAALQAARQTMGRDEDGDDGLPF